MITDAYYKTLQVGEFMSVVREEYNDGAVVEMVTLLPVFSLMITNTYLLNAASKI